MESTLTTGVLQQCRGIRDRSGLDCDCALVSVDDRIVLKVPQGIDPSVEIVARSKDASQAAAAARPRSYLPRTAPERSLLSCRPPQCDFYEWTGEPAREPRKVRAASTDYATPAERTGAACPPSTCEKNELKLE